MVVAEKIQNEILSCYEGKKERHVTARSLISGYQLIVVGGVQPQQPSPYCSCRHQA
jgi:hypothetical protein